MPPVALIAWPGAFFLAALWEGWNDIRREIDTGWIEGVPCGAGDGGTEVVERLRRFGPP